MKSVNVLLTELVSSGFEKAGYQEEFGKVVLSNRQDLCQYQCSGALPAAKQYKKNPFEIAEDVMAQLKEEEMMIEVVKPGFINISLSEDFIVSYLNQMSEDDYLGYTPVSHQKKIIVDYGGPNVAKPLHVGHLRSAIIGESIKRIYKFVGHDVVGDIHLGDWGLQIGIVIEELKSRQPDLIYFSESNEVNYPDVPPFTINELSDIYPVGSKKSKGDPSFLVAARKATAALQEGHQGYMALWHHITNVSMADLKSNYQKLNVEFDLWKGESHSMPVIPEVINILKTKGLTEENDGALIVPVGIESDKRPMPPFIVLKSDGAALYSTTDLATIYQRVDEYAPDEIIYVVDKRQELHFEQVFRCAKKAQISIEDMDMNFIGFGTMNGKDGKPFKTREGGIMKLEDLIHMLRDSVKEKVIHGRDQYDEILIDDISIKVGLAALKYGDLINHSAKDYVFDLDRFANFEGKTGPYIQYSIVRMKSILNKAPKFIETVSAPQSQTELNIGLKLIEFNSMVHGAYLEKAPNKICEYAYELSNLFNRFYHETNILKAEDEQQKSSWLSLLTLMSKVLEQCLELLGISVLEKM